MSEPTGAIWRKSGRSNGSGGHCVECAAVWRKSSRSNGSGGDCVEVAAPGAGIAVRDSKNPRRAYLNFTREAWKAFTRDVKSGAR